MTNQNAFLQTFAGGEFGDAMSARVGIEAYQASCEIMENWFSQAQGPMSRRPSLEYIDSFVNSDLKGVLKAFQFDVGQNYLLLLTQTSIEFFESDGKITLPGTTASISNGTFSNFTGWTDNSQSGASAGASSGVLALTSNGAAQAKARTTFTINESGVLHVIAFDVVNGPVNLRIGSSAGGEQFLAELELRTGHHRLSFTPTGSTGHIEFWHKGDSVHTVDNVSLLTGTAFSLPTPWAEEHLRGIYASQDGDRMFMFHRLYGPLVLERRAHRSWSLVRFEPDDGPFDDGDSTILLTPGATTGQTTLNASRDYFVASDVRRLVRVTHPGQFTKTVANDGAVYGDPIKVVGIGGDRSFDWEITGTWTGQVTLERSVGNLNQFTKLFAYAANDSGRFNDSYKDASNETTGVHDDSLATVTDDDTEGSLNNQTVYYRWAIYPGEFSSGTVTATLTYAGGGSTTGIARITSFNNSLQVGIEILKHFSSTGGSDVWDIGSWCSQEEFPNATAFSGGRLWTGRRRRLWSSVSDDYFSFDDGAGEADRMIDITLRSKSSEGIRWMRHLDFLCVGTRNEEYVMRSSNAAEGIGPSTIDPGLMSEEGGAGIEAAVGGDSILFVHRSGRRVYQFAHNPRALSESSFVATDLNRLAPESVEDGIVNISIQQEPERRIFVVLRSGIVKTALFRREEEIVAWSTVRSRNAFFEDVCIFPENDADAVYFIVRRKIGSTYVRMIERMQSELVLNDEDMVCIDSMLSTEIERPEAILTFDTIVQAATVEVEASQSVFNVGHEGQYLWADGGRIRIDTYNSAFSVTGTIVNSLDGEQDPEDETIQIPRAVPPGRWGIAAQVSSVTGLDHLEGEEVVIWADKAFAGTAVVDAGEVELPYAASRVFIGKRVVSRWKSLKLAYGGSKGTAVNQKKNVINMGFVLRKTADGLKFGMDFTALKRLNLQSSSPSINGSPLYTGEANDTVNGQWGVDPRLTLKADTPGPATILALAPNVQTNER